MPTVSPDRARAARLAVSAMFLVNGAIQSSILPRLPAIKDGLGLSNAELGAAVAAMPVGGLLAGGLVGILIGRFGSGRLATITGTLAALTLVGVGLAGSWATLAVAMLVLGMFDATMDASMNAHGIGVQRVYRRSILQGFHGMWSLGSMGAGAVGLAMAAAGVPVAVHLSVAAVLLAVTAATAGHWFLPDQVADAHPAHEPEPLPIRPSALPHLLRVLVPIAMLGILCVLLQSSAATWSAVYLADVLDQPAGIAALGYVLYMGAMVAGRMTNDRWVDRWGTVAVVRTGALIGAIAVALVMLAGPADAAPVALLGFALVGFGSSPMFPVLVAAAGSRPGIPARHGIAIAGWLVRGGLVLAPTAIGAAADAFGLGAALGISLVASLAMATATGWLTGTPRRRPAPGVVPAS